MAGWSTYAKVDQFVMLPSASIGIAAMTFVSQNIGGRQMPRARRGSLSAVISTVMICGSIQAIGWLFAPSAVRLFAKDPSVISYGVQFIRINFLFIAVNAINNILACSLRGYGDSGAL